MSNIIRQHAGTVIAGAAVGGQFAASTHTEADGAALASAREPVMSDDARALRLDEITRVRSEMQTVARAMHRQQLSLFEHQMALTIRAQHPDAQTLVLGRVYGETTEWRLAGVEGPGGEPVELDSDFECDLENEVANAAIDARSRDYDVQQLESGESPSSPYSAYWSETARLDLAISARDDHVDLSRAFVDTHYVDERNFSLVWVAAERDLNLSCPAVQTCGDFRDEICEGYADESGDELSAEQLDSLSKRASALYAEGDAHDMVYDLEGERRETAIAEAAKELGIRITGV